MRTVTEYERVKNDAKYIKQLVFEQDAVERSRSVLYNVVAGMIFQLMNLIYDLASDNCRIPCRLV